MPSNLVYDLALCDILLHCKVREGIVGLPTCASSFVHLSASVSLTLHTFAEKSDCGKINLVLSAISVTVVLVKPLQIVMVLYVWHCY